MDWYWIVLIIVASADLYFLAAWMLMHHQWWDSYPRTNAFLSILWPVTYPLYVLAVMVIMLFGKDED